MTLVAEPDPRDAHDPDVDADAALPAGAEADGDPGTDAADAADPAVSVLELALTAHPACMQAAELAAAIEALSTALRDPQIRVVVFAPKLRAAPLPSRLAARGEQVDALHDLLLALRDSDKPTLAALDTHAEGALLALALGCDVIVAARDVSLRLHAPDAAAAMAHEPAQDAAQDTPGDGALAAIWLASRRLPPGQAAALAFGHALDAPRAHALGLVLELAPPGLALEQAARLASQFARSRADRLAQRKRELADAASRDLAQVLADERAQWLRAPAAPHASRDNASTIHQEKP